MAGWACFSVTVWSARGGLPERKGPYFTEAGISAPDGGALSGKLFIL